MSRMSKQKERAEEGHSWGLIEDAALQKFKCFWCNREVKVPHPNYLPSEKCKKKLSFIRTAKKFRTENEAF